MFTAAVAAFVGCFAAMVALAEVQLPNKWLRYLLALLVGVLITFGLAWVLEKVSGVFSRVG